LDYKVVKIFNNNVIHAKEDKKEMILIGKGIGFSKKPGDLLPADSKIIEKIFHESNSNYSIEYLEMIPQYKKEIIGVSEEIIAKAEDILGPLSPNIHAALVDHISFALDRIKMGLPIENPFIDEIIILYPEEYEVAELAASLIMERLDVEIGEDEKGFITLHLHSAKTNKSIRQTMQDTRIYKTCMDLVADSIGQVYDDNDYIHYNFILSLKLIVHSSSKGNKISNPIKGEIKNRLVESYKIANDIASLFAKEKNIVLNEDMIAYIAMDIEKIRQIKI